MTRLGTSLWLVAVALLATACGGGQGPEGRDPSTTRQKVATVGPAASLQVTKPLPQIVNPAEELGEFAPGGILRWSEVPGADAYEVWAYADGGLSQVVESCARGPTPP